MKEALGPKTLVQVRKAELLHEYRSYGVWKKGIDMRSLENVRDPTQ